MLQTQMSPGFLNSRKKCLILGLISFVSFIINGTARLSGLLFVECIARYETGRDQAALPFIFCYTIRNISGPIVGYLGRKFGLIPVTLIGCLLATVGVGTCFFAEDIVTVTVFWGVVFGFGFGMGTSLIPQILNTCFERHVDKANGIYQGGGCIGAFLLPVIADPLIKHYDISGMFLILSAIIFNSVPAMFLLKSQDHSIPENNNDSRKTGCRRTGSGSQCSGSVTHHDELGSFGVKNAIQELNIRKDDRGNLCKFSNTSEFQRDSIYYIKSFRGDREKVQKQENSALNVYENNIINSKDGSTYNETSASINKGHIKIDENDTTTIEEKQNLDNAIFVKSSVQTDEIQTNVGLYLSNLDCRSEENKASSSNSAVKGTKELIVPSRPFQVFLDPAFIVTLLTQGLLLIVITTTWTIIVDVSRDKNVAQKDEIHVLICIGVADMMGRFCLGYITDGGYITKINFQALCFAGLGILLALFVILDGFVMVMIDMCVAGLLTGGLTMIGVGIINQYIEKENVTMAIASRYFAFASMSFTQAPIIGFFREKLKSYDGLLYLLAAMCAVCSVLTLLTPAAAKLRKKKLTS